MDKKDKLITISMLTLAAMISLFALPEYTTHISAESMPVASPTYFKNVTIGAKAAYVFDLTTNKPLYAKDANHSYPLASLTKIMTAITAAELVPSASTTITIDSQSLAESGDSGLFINEHWQLDKLLQLMLVVSSNDAASAVSNSVGGQIKTDITLDNRAAFVQAMNNEATTLNLPTLHFNNATGLDVTTIQAGGYGSAKDLAQLLGYAIKRDRTIIEPTRYKTFQATSTDGISHVVQNTDIISQEIPSLIAGKTGYTDLAGGNLAIVFDAGFQHPLEVVVLGSTYAGRFSDVKKLIDASIKTISAQ